MASIKSVEIKKLKKENIPALLKELSDEKPEYLKYFTAFVISQKSFEEQLTKVIDDKFFGVFYEEQIVGFYMLRGFDAGYVVPSYGVVISSRFSNRGLSKLTLYHAFSVCTLNNVEKLMLKVHPENKFAKRLYESLGFIRTGFDDKNGNYIYHKTL